MLLKISITRPLSSLVPWEKLRRNKSTPASTSLFICSDVELDGPNVATILVFLAFFSTVFSVMSPGGIASFPANEHDMRDQPGSTGRSAPLN
jgi:hypothetical protein